jgi:hypothetical protein
MPGFGRRSGLEPWNRRLDLLEVRQGCIPAGGICVQTYSCLTLRMCEDGVDGCQDGLTVECLVVYVANAEARPDAWNCAKRKDNRVPISRLVIVH